MKNENEGIELNIIKGIMGISNIYHVSPNGKLITELTLLSYYNDHRTKYNIDITNLIYPIFGASVYGIKKNGRKIKLAQRAWRRKI